MQQEVCLMDVWFYRFETVKDMWQKVGTTPILPRICGRQQQRLNVPSSTPSECYNRSISIPLLDHMISEVSSRFSSHTQIALQGMCLIPAVLVKMTKEEVRKNQ